MVSHDLTAMRQTAHRMIFLEETIRFDGDANNFPDLNRLADLRGITHVHENIPSDTNVWDVNTHSKEEE